MFKKFISILLLLALLCTSVITASAVSGTSAIGYTLKVKQQCNVRLTPDASGRHIGEVKKGNQYRIYGAARGSSGKWWYLVHAKDREVWISSAMVKVNSDSYSCSALEDKYYGWCVVKTTSCKLHRSYSTHTAKLGVGYQGQGYLIRNYEYTDGDDLWFEVMVEGTSMWIDSSNVNYHLY